MRALELVAMAFDESAARAAGVPTRALVPALTVLVAFYADAPTGASIVLVALAVYCATTLVGFLSQQLRPAGLRSPV